MSETPTGFAFSSTIRPPAFPSRKRGPAGTRAAAREEIHPHLTRLRAIVLAKLREAGEEGATDEQLEAMTGLSGSTVRPRRLELVVMGLARDSGSRRQTASGRWATVWIAAPQLSTFSDTSEAYE